MCLRLGVSMSANPSNLRLIHSASLAAALEYAAAGIAVLPLWSVRADGSCRCRDGADCPKPAKHPYHPGWQNSASSNPGTVRRDWPKALEHRDGYRVTSADLGRDLEEDLSITPSGIVDFGTADMGDQQAGKRTAIDLVLEWLPVTSADSLAAPSSPLEAALWLCDKLEHDPAELGYQPTAGDADGPGGAVLVEAALGDFMQAELEPVDWAIKPWLPRSCVTLLAGNGGVGKSNLALSLCAHLSTGQPFAGLQVAQLPCLFISLEDSAAIVRWRLRAVVEQFGLDAELIARSFRLVDGTEAQCAALLTQGENGAQLSWTKAYRELRDLAAGAQFIVIDNASDAMDANENSRSHVRTFIRGLAMIAKQQSAAVLLLSHLDKNAVRLGAAGSSYSGSTAWNASVRSRLALLDEEGQIILNHEKCNLAATAEPVFLHFEPGGVLVPDSMVRTALDGDLSATPAERDQAAALAAVIAASQAGVSVPDCLTPCAQSAMRALQPFPEYSTHFRGKAGGSRCAAALAALKRAGRLISEEYRKPNRHASTRLVASGSTQNQGET